MSPQTLRQKRRDAGLSQEMLARHVGVTIGTIRNWEKGVTVPTLANGKALETFFKRLDSEG